MEQKGNPGKLIRLNKYLSNAGVCSRREADELIASGQVRVNGKVVTELGSKVHPKDRVEYKGKALTPEKHVYILLNKPKNVVTSMDDPEGRKTVFDITKNATPERIYPVGRLDRNTTGLLLMTNDGELTQKILHPKFNKKKIYHVGLDKPVSKQHLKDMVSGFELEDGFINADAAAWVDDSKSEVGVEIHSGRNRIVRRIFEHMGYEVKRLDRVYYAGLTKKNLPRGKFRKLTQKELNILKSGKFK